MKNGGDFIYDRVTRVALQVGGKELISQAGRNLEITGIENPSTHVITVMGWKPVSGGNCAKFAKLAETSGVEAAAAATGAAGSAGAVGAAGAATAGGGAGIGTRATVAVVGGVAAAVTAGGLAASGQFSGSPSNAPNQNPPTSR